MWVKKLIKHSFLESCFPRLGMPITPLLTSFGVTTFGEPVDDLGGNEPAVIDVNAAPNNCESHFERECP
jgi:hypothetical protein